MGGCVAIVKKPDNGTPKRTNAPTGKSKEDVNINLNIDILTELHIVKREKLH